MRFSGREGDLGGVLSGSDPNARDKEKPQWARLVRAMMREKCTEGKGGKRNCRKYATEMNNEGEDSRAKGKRGRKGRNGGAARSANLGGYKGRAANGGEEKSGRYYRPEKEERSEAGTKGK